MQRTRNYISRLILLFSTFLRIKHVRLGRFRCRICIRLRLNIYLCSINHFRTVFENMSTLAASEKGLCTYKTFTSMQISTLSTCPICLLDVTVIALSRARLIHLTSWITWSSGVTSVPFELRPVLDSKWAPTIARNRMFHIHRLFAFFNSPLEETLLYLIIMYLNLPRSMFSWNMASRQSYTRFSNTPDTNRLI